MQSRGGYAMTRPKGISTRRMERWVWECEAEVVEATAQGIASPQQMHDIVYRRDYWRDRLAQRQAKEKARESAAVVEANSVSGAIQQDKHTTGAPA